MSDENFITKRKKSFVRYDKIFNEINIQKTKENIYCQNFDCKLFDDQHDFYWKPSLKLVLNVSYILI